MYEGCYREVCPLIIGGTAGEEKVLSFQFGGQSNSKLPPGGQWRCLYLAKVSEVRLRDGPWHEGREHRTTQRCVEDIDIDVNVHVRKLRRTTS